MSARHKADSLSGLAARPLLGVKQTFPGTIQRMLFSFPVITRTGMRTRQSCRFRGRREMTLKTCEHRLSV